MTMRPLIFEYKGTLSRRMQKISYTGKVWSETASIKLEQKTNRLVSAYRDDSTGIDEWPASASTGSIG